MIDLRDNINLWGPPPSAADTLRTFDAARLAAYPAPRGGRLRPALARFLGVPAGSLALGCGSDELIDLAFRLAGPGAGLDCRDPEFSMVPVFARANGLRRDAGGDVKYLSAPHNPTGALPSEAEIRALLRAPARLVILDGAYAEFGDGPDWFTEALASDRVLVIRTFSKAWGLAGLRLGYAVGAPPLISRLEALRSPYSVSVVAEEIGAAVIARDAVWMRDRCRDTIASRERLLDALRELGAAPLPSRANFVLLPVPGAAAIAARLFERGIAVRLLEALPGIGDAIRIGVGPWPLMGRFLAAFQEAMACA